MLRIALPLGLALAAWGLFEATRRLDHAYRSPLPVAAVQPFHPDRITPPSAAAGILTEPLPVEFAVKPGETPSQLFTDLGLEADEARQAAAALARYVEPRKLKAGARYAAFLDSQAGLTSFEMRLEGEGRVRLARHDGSWQSTWLPMERKLRTRVVHGRLASSLEQAIRDQEASTALAYRMADALQWDLDFTRDLRIDDRFQVLFEEVFLDGEYYAVGEVLALRYENRGSVYEAYRFGAEEGFYDADGRPLRKMFLRSPLRFSRITSRFSHRRFHPVLKTYRPHYGVDYGAPTGTPVRVTASGTVQFAGWDRGGGKTVKVRHPGGYLTAYLHLSRFAQGIRPGRTVRQGEVVGYVGSTGLSTAPHLDYRVQHNGRWIDPLTIKSVPARALASSEMPAFREWRDALRASLASGSPLPPDIESRPDRDVQVAASRQAVTTAGAGRR